MVLKKSNSGLNSGATQHVRRGGFIDPRTHLRHTSLYGSIEVSVEMPTIEMADEVDACLEEINGYLDFTWPRFPSSRKGWNRTSSVSCDKGGNWQLKQRLHDLMKDIEFLRYVSGTIDIHFTEISENLAKGRSETSSTKTKTSSQILKEFESEENEREKARLAREGVQSKKRQTYHGRGVQRRYQSTLNKQSDRNDNQRVDESASELKPTLTFTFHNPCAVDARASKLCKDGDKYDRWYCQGLKSLKKSKGFVNGMRSENRDFTHNVIKDTEGLHFRDQQRTLNVDDVSFSEIEACEDCSDPSYTFSLGDFITKNKAMKRKHTSRKSEHVPLPSKEAIFWDKSKHPKGSYIYIEPDSDSSLLDSSWEVIEIPVAGDLENDCQADFPNNGEDKADRENIHGASVELHSKPMEISAEDVTQEQENVSKSFTECFVGVQASMPGDGITLFPETLDRLQLHGRSNVTVGDSLPHCFSISPSHHSLNKPYIVARRASKDGKTWLFSLQGSSELKREHFRSKLSRLHQSDEKISLVQAIKVAEEVLNSGEDCQEVVDIDSGDTGHAESKDSELDAWVDLASKFMQEVSIHTVEEAAEKMILPSAQPKRSGVESKHGAPNISEDIECGVCFSPCNLYGKSEEESAMMLLSCGHLHCIGCWRAHVYHSINSGAPKISCMTNGCDAVLDETTLKTLAPVSMVTLWQARLRDRLLQSSQHTSWCPHARCGHVAISRGTPLKKQFGSPLVCRCLRSWCSNCQEDPHWPVSCDQMAAYKKLLSKAGKDSYLPVAQISFVIDMKKCPKCKYPIEKFQGCPSMVCRMCWHNFCWNCLQSTEKHNVYTCKVSPSSNFITFQLHNKLLYDFPIEYFIESLQTNKQRELLRQKRNWLHTLRGSLQSKFSLHRLLSSRKVGGFSSHVAVTSTLELIDEVLAFMKRAFTHIELFYILLGFAELNKTKSAARLVAATNRKVSRLHFIVDRLSTHIVGRSLSHISSMNKQARILLKTGSSTLDELFGLAPQLQNVSKDVATAWIAEIDPSKHLHYK
ncbi:hypothetical protein EGW08_003254 [Elysia chlorotica]|uniref:RBR-type E3 ubiquitin transferase n=1 Tax=Elysia chlorotica TaxID=188477 RepID=A0A433U5B7_ELYCH|nr:hypothetical protein EGW08_003254 [Elysia chlorotica]